VEVKQLLLQDHIFCEMIHSQGPPWLQVQLCHFLAE
jgi:hypothetical protein